MNPDLEKLLNSNINNIIYAQNIFFKKFKNKEGRDLLFFEILNDKESLVFIIGTNYKLFYIEEIFVWDIEYKKNKIYKKHKLLQEPMSLESLIEVIKIKDLLNIEEKEEIKPKIDIEDILKRFSLL